MLLTDQLAYVTEINEFVAKDLTPLSTLEKLNLVSNITHIIKILYKEIGETIPLQIEDKLKITIRRLEHKDDKESSVIAKKDRQERAERGQSTYHDLLDEKIIRRARTALDSDPSWIALRGRDKKNPADLGTWAKVQGNILVINVKDYDKLSDSYRKSLDKLVKRFGMDLEAVKKGGTFSKSIPFNKYALVRGEVNTPYAKRSIMNDRLVATANTKGFVVSNNRDWNNAADKKTYIRVITQSGIDNNGESYFGSFFTLRCADNAEKMSAGYKKEILEVLADIGVTQDQMKKGLNGLTVKWNSAKQDNQIIYANDVKMDSINETDILERLLRQELTESSDIDY